MDNNFNTPPQYDWQNSNLKTFDFGRVFGQSVTGTFHNPKALLIGLVVVAVITIGMSLITVGITNSVMQSEITEDTLGGIFGVTIGTNVVSLMLAVWFQLIIVNASYSHITGNQDSSETALARATRQFLPMFVIAIIYSLVCIMGFYALLIGFVFVWPGWALAGPVYVFEKAGVFGSLGRAWTLARGNKRWVFLLLLVISVISFIIFGAILGILYVITDTSLFDVDTLDSNTFMSSPGLFIFSILSSIVTYILYGWFAAAMTAAYVEIKTLKEGAPTVAEVFA